jgi:RNA polymerase sigma-70 factor, ECF subfamily
MDFMPKNQHLPDGSRAEEFLELYSSCQRSLYVYIVTLIGNPIDAHDVLQDTSLVLWEKFSQFEIGTNFHAWAREVARYRVLRYRQLHANDAPILEPHVLDALATRLDDVDQRHRLFSDEMLSNCVQNLGPTDQELIRLRYMSGVQVKALAEQLHRSQNAVSQSLARIRKLLRECVEQSMRQREKEEDFTP